MGQFASVSGRKVGTIPNHLVVNGIKAAENHGTGGRTDGIIADGIGKVDALFGEAVEYRSLDFFLPQETKFQFEISNYALKVVNTCI